MATASSDAMSVEAPRDQKMVWVPGGSFRMGSDRHYPEEAPVHRVTVDGFWIDRTPVTNAEFLRFIRATGYLTFAEIRPKASDYPGVLPRMLRAPPFGRQWCHHRIRNRLSRLQFASAQERRFRRGRPQGQRLQYVMVWQDA
jgi:formylglycine-generating enzyme required for sulfatase activity